MKVYSCFADSGYSQKTRMSLHPSLPQDFFPEKISKHPVVWCGGVSNLWLISCGCAQYYSKDSNNRARVFRTEADAIQWLIEQEQK